MTDILSASAPRVFSLPPSAAFLDELAKGLIDATGAKQDPELLADALIFTPNRRSGRELALSLYRAMGSSLLAPDIRTLGDMDEDGLAAFGPDALDLPPSMSAAKRRGALSRLVQGWREAQGAEKLPPSSLLAAADELGALIDQAALAGGVDWDKLKGVSEELAPALALHWQASASFLDIVMHVWPSYLKEQDASDEQTRRLAAAEALRTRWRKEPPQRPVIIAGSTGAGAATRILMEEVLTLPMGAIVFPGVDPDLGPGAWQSVADAASHPQHVLGETLKRLRLKPGDVQPFPNSAEKTPKERARRRLLNEALAPAVETRGWNERLKNLAKPGAAKDLVTEGLGGLCLVEAEDEAEEALVAALLLRETLETPERTAALVTPEAALARRVSAILERWGLDVPPSEGVRLQRTRAASFLLLLIRWALDPAEPVQLLSVLKHACFSLGYEPDRLRALVSQLELTALRGARLDRTLEQLAVRLETKHRKEAAELVRRLDGLHAPFSRVFFAEKIDGEAAAEAARQLAESLAPSPGEQVWAGRQGEMAAKFLGDLSQLSASMGPMDRDAYPDFADALAQQAITPPETQEHPRIAIWGPLEARLQRRDRMILASLNEGSWPKPAAADAFLNRTLRKRIGLPDPDERIGLSAHDFAQMANAPDVVLLRARRVDDKPAVASRWVWRLRTLAAGGLGGRDAAEAALKPPASADPLVWARAVRSVPAVAPVKPPRPSPPTDRRRLVRFSPSRAVTLIRDPYADFAANSLGLVRLRRVGEEIDAAQRGAAVHTAIEKYEKEENETALDDLIVAELHAAGASQELTQLEKPLWLRAVRAYMAWAKARKPGIVRAELEKSAILPFSTKAGPAELKAKADRIEQLKDGSLAVIDFKTGAPKSFKQVQSGIEPQLSLEAAIAARLPFGGVGPAKTSELIYFQISTSSAVLDDRNGKALKLEKPVDVVAEEAFEGLQRLIELYARPDQPFLSRPRVFSVKIFSDFDRLARRAEWTVEEGEE